MKIAIVAIGDELLIGQVTDTNSGAIARMINPEGWELARVQVVADDAEEIRTAIDRAFEVAPVVITTGGLGPTKDDITKGVLTGIFGGELIYDESVMTNVRSIFERRHLPLNRLTEGQAMVPSSCSVVQNRYGTAPIMWFDSPRGVLVAMPGVPFETEGMFAEEILPRLRGRFAATDYVEHRTVITTGISESALAEQLAQFESSLPAGAHIAYLPNAGYIRLRLDCHGCDKAALAHKADELAEALCTAAGKYVIAKGDYTPAQMVLKLAGAYGCTLSTAESCTGGNIAGAITSIPGSSEHFLGGIVAYSNSVKTALLSVDPAVIEAKGAVSEEVVAQMAQGACKATGASVGIATSGIAGPGGGTQAKPVGTVCIGVCCGGAVRTITEHFPGNRRRVVERSVSRGLLLACEMMREAYPSADPLMRKMTEK